MKTIKTENKYSTFTRNVQLKIDEFFAEKIIPENDSVRLLDEIAEEVKESLERVLKRTGRNFKTSPVTMLKVILYAAMENIYSGRDKTASYAICFARRNLLPSGTEIEEMRKNPQA